MMWHHKKITIVVALTFLFHITNALIPRIDPLVETNIGLIRGLKASDGDYSMFMGIPYATVNESNPFGPSVPHPGFDTTFDAYDDSAVCPQKDEFSNTVFGSIDCLHINIYVPDTANSRNALPVMVWIYGGAFSIGSAGRRIYGPRFLVKQDVILVTFNYRLGPYGFMCLGTPDVPGNQGLKDQQLALHWVKNNINAFGGDTSKITIFGESAGSVSVNFHIIYGKDKLFDKAIMQSGVAVSPWGVVEPNTLAPLQLAEYLGLSTTDTNEALGFLASSDPNLIIAASSELNLSFRPCVEQNIDNVESFINDYPINVKDLNLGNMPLLMGYNKDEMLNTYEFTTPEAYSQMNVFHNTLKDAFNFINEDLIEMETQIRQFYIGDEEFSGNVRQSLVDFSSDFSFNYPTVRTINYFLDHGLTNIYHYLFAYDGGRAFQKLRFNVTSAGVAHADEISYFFDVLHLDKNPTVEDQLTIDRVTTLWTNFAKYGKPIPEISELLPVQWPATTKDILYYLNIDSELEIKKRNYNRRIAMWNLFYKINEKYQLGYRDSFE